MARGDANGARKYPERIARGEQSPRAKMTTAQVLEIRRRYAAGEGSLRQLAREYDITEQNVFRIVKRLAWQHVPPEEEELAMER